MIYELTDTSKVANLFAGMDDTLILSCLQNVMGQIFVTDPEEPRSAMTFLGRFAFYAGEPDRTLVAEKPEGFVIMVPQNEAWAKLIEECFPQAEKELRYAIRKNTKFDRASLERIAAALPSGYEVRRIDAEIYDMCMASGLFIDCVCHFGSKEQYLEHGRGFAVLKDGQLVSAASSFTVYREGIEIEIDTVEEERRKGLASAAGARLILSCLDEGLYPSWDAANMDSVHLAEKLGYEFSHEYVTYFVSGDSEGAAATGGEKMLNEELIRKTEAFLKQKFDEAIYLNAHPDAKAYRIEHTYRVANIGREIAAREGFDGTEMVVACLLHDISYCEEFGEDGWVGHGRRAAQIARPFLEELGLAEDRIQDICYGIAIHVDDKADFPGERTPFALSVGDADNIDRFDVYRIHESLVYEGFLDKPFDEKCAFVEKRLARLRELKDMPMGTNAAEELWKERLGFYITFFEKLAAQLEQSTKIYGG
nr:GNAT family N-acetyltransferase [Lachnospiraceae bacterium]